MYVEKLIQIGIRCLGDLQFHQLHQLQEELDVSWNSGQSKISNNLYDKVVDGVNYEISQLTNDPFNYIVRKTDSDLKDLVDYLGQRHSQGKPIIDDVIYGILYEELVLRKKLIIDPTITYPAHWTTVSNGESPVQLVSLTRSSQEFQDISDYFIKSLGQSSTVVYSITRIENLRLWNIHQQLQRTIQCQSTRLIHGTASKSQQKSIIYHGFSRCYCPNGTIGDGVYFALRASYSNDDSYVMKKSAHRRELFICQVLLGKTTLGKIGLRSPPVDHHAVHFSNFNEIDEFCIFNHYQAYPEYIIQYDYE